MTTNRKFTPDGEIPTSRYVCMYVCMYVHKDIYKHYKKGSPARDLPYRVVVVYTYIHTYICMYV